MIIKMFTFYFQLSYEQDLIRLKEENQILENHLNSSKQNIYQLQGQLKEMTSHSDEMTKKNVKKIMNKSFKFIKSEMEGREENNEEFLELIASNFRNVTDQLFNDNKST